jgi:hypothetical protein
MADIYLARAEGNPGAARDMWRETHRWLSEREIEVQEVFDLHVFTVRHEL